VTHDPQERPDSSGGLGVDFRLVPQKLSRVISCDFIRFVDKNDWVFLCCFTHVIWVFGILNDRVLLCWVLVDEYFGSNL
jgi:hypothetical protein